MATLQKISAFPENSSLKTFLNLPKEPNNPNSNSYVTDFNDELIITANKNNFAIAKKGNSNTFHLTYSEKFVNIFENDMNFTYDDTLEITAVKILTFELALNYNYYVAVGFNTGHVKFILPETGDIILSKWLHNVSVKEIRQDILKIDVIYEDEIVQILPNNLHDALRKGKASLALKKAKAKDENFEDSIKIDLEVTKIKTPLVAPGSPHQVKINSATIDFPKQDSIFDQLWTASLEGPNTYNYISKEPIAFENCVMAQNQAICNFGVVLPRKAGSMGISVKNVGNLLGSAVSAGFSLFGRGNTKTQEQLEAELREKNIEKPYEPAKESMLQRFTTEDVNRSSNKVVTFGNFSLISDNLGRVWLIDRQSKAATRVFKGYRNAECAFLTESIFVILAPHRNILEIWSLFGSRLAAFNVAKNSKLIVDQVNVVYQNDKLVNRIYLFSLTDDENGGNLYELEVKLNELLNLLCSNNESKFRQLKKDCKTLSSENKLDQILTRLQNMENLTLEQGKILSEIVLNSYKRPTEDLVNFLKNLSKVESFGDESSFSEEINLTKNFLNVIKINKTERKRLQKRRQKFNKNNVKFTEKSSADCSFAQFLKNDPNDIVLAKFLFEGLSSAEWKFLKNYHTFDRFFIFLDLPEVNFLEICDKMQPSSATTQEKENDQTSEVSKNLQSQTSFVSYEIFDDYFDKLLELTNLPNVVFILELLLSQVDEDEIDSKSEKYRIALQRAEEASQISKLPNIGTISLKFLMENSFDEIISKWIAINCKTQIFCDANFETESKEEEESIPTSVLPNIFQVNNVNKLVSLISYELAINFTQNLEIKYLELALQVIKNPNLIKIVHQNSFSQSNQKSQASSSYSINFQTIEILELIWRNVLSARLMELLNMVERTGHRPPVKKIAKIIGLETLEDVLKFLKISREVLSILLDGQRAGLVSTETAGPNKIEPAICTSPCWNFLEDMDGNLQRTTSLLSILAESHQKFISKNQKPTINSDLVKIWRSIVNSLDLIIELDIKLRVRHEKNIITMRPVKDLGHGKFRVTTGKTSTMTSTSISPDTDRIVVGGGATTINQSNYQLPNSLYLIDNFSENLDLEMIFKREAFINHVLSYILTSVDDLPSGITAEYDEDHKSRKFNIYIESINLLINDWQLSESKFRLFQDLSLKLVVRGYDTISLGILNMLDTLAEENITENFTNSDFYSKLLELIAGRILAWQFTRANPSDSALVYSKLSQEHIDFIENCPAQENRPILLSSVNILNYVGERFMERQEFCDILISIVQMIYDENMDPLVVGE